MPYKCFGKDLYHKIDGRWKIKQRTKSKSNCQAALRLLYGLKSGDIKKEDVGKSKLAKKIKG